MPTPSVLQRITFDEELENANIGRIRAEQRRYLECHHRKGPHFGSTDVVEPFGLSQVFILNAHLRPAVQLLRPARPFWLTF